MKYKNENLKIYDWVNEYFNLLLSNSKNNDDYTSYEEIEND